MRIGCVKIHALSPMAARCGGPGNFLVEVCNRRGATRGWGEGVVGSSGANGSLSFSLERLFEFLRLASFPWNLTSSDHVWAYVAELPESQSDNPVVCAIEMALLDALGHAQEKPLTAFFPIHHGTGTVRYGATLSVSDDRDIMNICQRLSRMGIHHIRIQMSNDVSGNLRRMEAVEKIFCKRCEVCLDPGGKWTRDLAMAHLPMIRHAPVHVVEEPMPYGHDGFNDFATALAKLGVHLMAGRSGATLNEVRHLITATPYRLVDVELSRNGGFYRTLKIIDMLRTHGIGYRISHHHLEKGILSAAGRALNLICGDARYRDGAHYAHRPCQGVTHQINDFGHGGEVGPLRGAGVGVRVDRRRLERLRRGAALVVSAPQRRSA